MCMLVFISSDKPLPIVPWDSNNPAFHVRELIHDSERVVREHFENQHVYYTGSHEKCGCGFSFGEDPEWEDVEEFEANRASAAALADYLGAAREGGFEIQVYACEAGRESRSPTLHRALSASHLRADRFWFRDGELITIEDEKRL